MPESLWAAHEAEVTFATERGYQCADVDHRELLFREHSSLMRSITQYRFTEIVQINNIVVHPLSYNKEP
jgi:hypothetical protein